MRPYPQTQLRIARPGYTLLELMVAVGISSILVVGMMSTVGIVLKASDTSIGPATGTREAHATITRMSSELQLATAFSEKTATAFTVTVPDQDFDTVDETIRYAWSGTPGSSLTRQYNDGAVTDVVYSVQAFETDYTPSVGAVEVLTLRLQISSNPSATIRTAVTLVNEP